MKYKYFLLIAIFFGIAWLFFYNSKDQRLKRQKETWNRRVQEFPEKNQSTTPEVDKSFDIILNDLSRFYMIRDATMPDSNELYFSYKNFFDTTRFVHILRIDSLVMVQVCLVPPPHADDYKIAEGKSPQFFEGMNFNISAEKWKQIKHQADSILSIPSGPRTEYGAGDHILSVLAFNSKITESYNSREIKKLKAFMGYLRHEILLEAQAMRPIPPAFDYRNIDE